MLTYFWINYIGNCTCPMLTAKGNRLFFLVFIYTMRLYLHSYCADQSNTKLSVEYVCCDQSDGWSFLSVPRKHVKQSALIVICRSLQRDWGDLGEGPPSTSKELTPQARLREDCKEYYYVRITHWLLVLLSWTSPSNKLTLCKVISSITVF